MGNGVLPYGLSYRAHPQLYPSVTAWAHRAFPELRANRPHHHLRVTAALDPKLTRAVGSANPDQTPSPGGEPDELPDGELQRRAYCTGELKESRNSISDFIPERMCRK